MDITTLELLLTADPTAPPAVSESFGGLKADPTGILWTRDIASSGGGGARTSRNPDSDQVIAINTVAYDSSCFLYGLNALQSWDRITVSGNNLDGLATKSTGVLNVNSHLKALNKAAGTYTRISASANDSDAIVPLPDVSMMDVNSHNLLFDETVFHRQRGNFNKLIFVDALRTADAISPNYENINSRGLHLIVVVSAFAPGAEIIPIIRGVDTVSGLSYELLVGDSITSTGIHVLKIYPGITALAGGAANDILPAVYNIFIDHQTVDAITYSVGANVMV